MFRQTELDEISVLTPPELGGRILRFQDLKQEKLICKSKVYFQNYTEDQNMSEQKLLYLSKSTGFFSENLVA